MTPTADSAAGCVDYICVLVAQIEVLREMLGPALEVEHAREAFFAKVAARARRIHHELEPDDRHLLLGIGAQPRPASEFISAAGVQAARSPEVPDAFTPDDVELVGVVAAVASPRPVEEAASAPAVPLPVDVVARRMLRAEVVDGDELPTLVATALVKRAQFSVGRPIGFVVSRDEAHNRLLVRTRLGDVYVAERLVVAA